MPDLLEGPRKGREEGRLELPSVDSCRCVLNKPSRQPMLKPSVSSLANAVLWPRLPLELLIAPLLRRPLITLGGCAFTALLAREPKAVSLSNHRIAGDTPTKPLRNRAGSLSRQPKAGQKLCSRLVPLLRHTGSQSCLPPAMVRRVLAGRLGLSLSSKPILDLSKERHVGN